MHTEHKAPSAFFFTACCQTGPLLRVLSQGSSDDIDPVPKFRGSEGLVFPRKNGSPVRVCDHGIRLSCAIIDSHALFKTEDIENDTLFPNVPMEINWSTALRHPERRSTRDTMTDLFYFFWPPPSVCLCDREREGDEIFVLFLAFRFRVD